MYVSCWAPALRNTIKVDIIVRKEFKKLKHLKLVQMISGGGKKTEYNNINVNFSYLGYIKRIVNNLFKEYII
jgi:hypothetical protein